MILYYSPPVATETTLLANQPPATPQHHVDRRTYFGVDVQDALGHARGASQGSRRERAASRREQEDSQREQIARRQCERFRLYA